jgi:phosphoenolpyruvate synthase/pyruvate phosphate dikinase
MPVYWLESPECSDPKLVGGKAASLSRLASAYRVPPGFCLTADASVDRDVIPPDLREELESAYAELGRRLGTADPPVAVRSSALDEDSAGASFAGAHETCVNVIGIEDVAKSVLVCWASAVTERALTYRRSHDLAEPDAPLPVLVQAMVIADVSAVVFSVNPVTGERDEVVINASWGLGESIVGGSVNPDTYYVSRGDSAEVRHDVAIKERMTVAVEQGSKEVGVPWLMRDKPVLDDDQAREMAELAVTLERECGWPVDLECCWFGGQLYLVQCRPVTALPPPGDGSGAAPTP